MTRPKLNQNAARTSGEGCQRAEGLSGGAVTPYKPVMLTVGSGFGRDDEVLVDVGVDCGKGGAKCGWGWGVELCCCLGPAIDVLVFGYVRVTGDPAELDPHGWAIAFECAELVVDFDYDVLTGLGIWSPAGGFDCGLVVEVDDAASGCLW